MNRLVMVAAVLTCWGATAWSLAASPEEELQQLQGVWIVQSAEIEGDKIEEFNDVHTVIKGDTLTVTVGGAVSTAKIKLNTTPSPKQLDTTDDEGKSMTAIYMLTGDTLQVCLNVPLPGAENLPRPDKFTTEAGSGRMLMVYRRAAATQTADGGSKTLR